MHTRARETSRRRNARGLPKIRDYRLSQGFWPFSAEWFWGVNFKSCFKLNQWDSFSWFLSFAPVIDKLRKTLSQMKHCALFILIGPGLDQVGHNLSRGKITASHFEEEMNIEFGFSVISNFFRPKKWSRKISKACQTLLLTLALPSSRVSSKFRARAFVFRPPHNCHLQN